MADAEGEARRGLPAAATLTIYAVAVLAALTFEQLRLPDAIAIPAILVALTGLGLALGRRRPADYGLRPGAARDEFAALGIALAFVAMIAGFFLLWRALGVAPGRASPLPRTGERLAAWAGRWGILTLRFGLPEELFFRGFLQAELRGLDRARRPFLGAPVGPSLILTSLLFAAAHAIPRLRPAEIGVFFPGLLFGWLRERSGSLIAPALFHGLYNVAILALRGGI